MNESPHGPSAGRDPDGSPPRPVPPEPLPPHDGLANGGVPRRLLETPLFGLVMLDAWGRVLEANDTFLDMVGQRREAMAQGLIHWETLTPPRHAHATARALGELRRGGSVAPFEKEYVRPDGRHVPVLIGLSALEGGRLLAVVQELTERRHAEATLRFLADASRALASPREPPAALLQRVAHLATREVATFCLMDLVQPDGQLRRQVVSHREAGQEPRVRQLLRTPHTEGEATPLLEVLHTGAPRLLADLPLAARDRLDTLEPHSVLVAPLKSRQRVLGLLLLGRCPPEAPFSAQDLGLVEELARRIVAALDNARLLGETRRAERRARFLARASRLMALALDVPLALESVSRLAVPLLADWCAVDLVDEEGTIHRTAVSHPDAERARLIWEMEGRWPPRLGDDSGTGHVIRTAQPELCPEVAEASLARLARDAAHLEALRALDIHSYLLVPLQARGRTLGALKLVHAASRRRFQHSDLRMAVDLAGRMGLAVDNARLYRQAQEAVRVRDEFLVVASHELKTPLTPLTLRLQSLQRELESPHALERDRLRGHARVLRRQTQRLATLVESLLDVSRIESGTLRLDLEDVDLAEVVGQVAERYAGQADRARSRLELHGEGPLVGRWDRVRLEQVVSSLLSNALKYGAGRPVHARLERHEGRARLTVRDEGIGIEPRHLPFIFGRFERRASPQHFGGLGLGLYVSRYLVEALGGTIRASSEPGQGATFEVTLPLAGPPG